MRTHIRTHMRTHIRTHTRTHNVYTLYCAPFIIMKECIWIEDKSENYPTQKLKINKQTTQFDFYKLKSELKANHSRLPNRSSLNKSSLFIVGLLSIPNIIPLWITRKVISKFDDIVFVSSMKYAMGVFFFPIWWFVSGLALAYAFGNPVMTLYFVICITTLFIRQRILLS